MKNLVNQRRTISLRSLHEWDAPSNQDFLSPLQKLRPSCDGIYMNELRIFEFLSSFLSDAVCRSITALPAPDDTAHLNSRGEVLRAGSRIGESFQEIFGSSSWECQARGDTPAGQAFQERFRSFLYSANPSSSRFTWKKTEGKRYEFRFQLQPGFGALLSTSVNTVVLVFQQSDEQEEDTSILPLKKAQELYELTEDEIAVVRAIYKGYTNREIGMSLGVSESTIKRRLGSIYKKTKVASRTRLLFLLSI